MNALWIFFLENWNVNPGVKAIMDLKKSAKVTADVKPLTRSVDWPNFRAVKMVNLVAIFSEQSYKKIHFR